MEPPINTTRRSGTLHTFSRGAHSDVENVRTRTSSGSTPCLTSAALFSRLFITRSVAAEFLIANLGLYPQPPSQPGVGTFFNPGVVSPIMTWLAKTADEAIAWYATLSPRQTPKLSLGSGTSTSMSGRDTSSSCRTTGQGTKYVSSVRMGPAPSSVKTREGLRN